MLKFLFKWGGIAFAGYVLLFYPINGASAVKWALAAIAFAFEALITFGTELFS